MMLYGECLPEVVAMECPSNTECLEATILHSADLNRCANYYDAMVEPWSFQPQSTHSVPQFIWNYKSAVKK